MTDQTTHRPPCTDGDVCGEPAHCPPADRAPARPGHWPDDPESMPPLLPIGQTPCGAVSEDDESVHVCTMAPGHDGDHLEDGGPGARARWACKETAGTLSSAGANASSGPVSLVSTDGQSLGDALRALGAQLGPALGSTPIDHPVWDLFDHFTTLARQADRLERERDEARDAQAVDAATCVSALQKATRYRAQVEQVNAMFRWTDCHEAVTDEDGEEQPCCAPAVAWRLDPGRYPVCAEHVREPMASLAHLRAALDPEAGSAEHVREFTEADHQAVRKILRGHMTDRFALPTATRILKALERAK